MPISFREPMEGRVVEVTLTGKVVKEDYDPFVPAMDRLVEQHGKIRMLLDMHDFHGWTAGAAWEDAKFSLHHFSKIERLAFVGEKKWQHGLAEFFKPLHLGTLRYFDQTAINEARAWLGEN